MSGQEVQLCGGLLGQVTGLLDSNNLLTIPVVIDSSRHIYLHDHVISGKPVLPATFALELLCESAAALNPTFTVSSVENFEVLGGVVFDQEMKKFRLTLTDAVTNGNGSGSRGRKAFDAVLYSEQFKNKIHFRARVHLTDATLTSTPGGLISKLQIARSERNPGVNEIYQEILFHGPLFQGVSNVVALGREGCAGKVLGTDPMLIMSPPSSLDWVFDPILLDNAMQLAAVWVKTFFGAETLPSGMKSIKFFEKLTQRKVNAQVRFGDKVTMSDLICDLDISDDGGNPIAQITGLTGVAMRALAKKDK